MMSKMTLNYMNLNKCIWFVFSRHNVLINLFQQTLCDVLIQYAKYSAQKISTDFFFAWSSCLEPCSAYRIPCTLFCATKKKENKEIHRICYKLICIVEDACIKTMYKIN